MSHIGGPKTDCPLIRKVAIGGYTGISGKPVINRVGADCGAGGG